MKIAEMSLVGTYRKKSDAIELVNHLMNTQMHNGVAIQKGKVKKTLSILPFLFLSEPKKWSVFTY